MVGAEWASGVVGGASGVGWYCVVDGVVWYGGCVGGVEWCVLGVACEVSQTDHPIMLSCERAKGVFDKLITISPIVTRKCTVHGPKLGRKKKHGSAQHCI